MKWYDVKEKLPPTHNRVLVCREIRISGIPPIPTHDIGMLKGTDPSDRWELESQQYSPLPTTPTLSSGIVTHWARLPKLPHQESRNCGETSNEILIGDGRCVDCIEEERFI